MKYWVQPELTNHCNFKCIYCPHSVYRKETQGGNQFTRAKGYMSEELWNLVLHNSEKHAEFVGLGFFGEPLLHPDFIKFIHKIPSQRPYQLHINTNWSLATIENMETLKCFDLVRISIDSSYAELWEKLCPGGHVLDLDGTPSKDRFNTLVKKIKYWLSLPDHAPTRLVYVVSSRNQHDRNKFIKQWRPRLGSNDHIQTKQVLSYGGVIKDSSMKINDCNIKKMSPVCLQVAWNGDCTPCNLDVNIEWNIGNLATERDLSNMVNSVAFRKVMSGIQNNEGICANCFDANNRIEDQYYWKTIFSRKKLEYYWYATMMRWNQFKYKQKRFKN